MIPCLGAGALVGGIGAVWLLVKKKDRVLLYLPSIYIGLIAFQLVRTLVKERTLLILTAGSSPPWCGSSTPPLGSFPLNWPSLEP
jgi:uncharacterized membrane protein YfcA